MTQPLNLITQYETEPDPSVGSKGFFLGAIAMPWSAFPFAKEPALVNVGPVLDRLVMIHRDDDDDDDTL